MGKEEHSSERVSIFFFRFSIINTRFPPEALNNFYMQPGVLITQIGISEEIRFPGSSKDKSLAPERSQYSF